MKIEIDLRDFERAARDLGAAIDQVPFALANAMTNAAFRTKDVLVQETWPQHVTVRNQNFLKAALNVKRATKRDLSISVYDRLGRGSLLLHAEGGQKSPRGSALAVPRGGTRRSAKGVPAGLRPRALPNSFVPATGGPKFRPRLHNDAIYQRIGKYKKATASAVKKANATGQRAKGGDGRGLKLMYVLKPSVRMPADVPFEQDFERAFLREAKRSFPAAIKKAMDTRRRK